MIAATTGLRGAVRVGPVARAVVALIVAALMVTSGHVHTHEHRTTVGGHAAPTEHDHGGVTATDVRDGPDGPEVHTHAEVGAADVHVHADHTEAASRPHAFAPVALPHRTSGLSPPAPSSGTRPVPAAATPASTPVSERTVLQT